MNKFVLLGLYIVSTFSHASHTLIDDNLICTYKKVLVSRILSPSIRDECSSLTYESVHLFVPERKGYIAGNGKIYTLQSGKEIAFSNEAFIAADANGNILQDATWVQSPILMNGQDYQEEQRDNATCYRSNKEELCVEESKIPSWLPSWLPLWLKEMYVE